MDLFPSDEHFAQQFAKQVITYWQNDITQEIVV